MALKKLYCPECSAYLEGGSGDLVDCHCGWKQPETIDQDEREPDYIIFECDDCGGKMVDEHETRCHCCGDKGTWTAIPVVRLVD